MKAREHHKISMKPLISIQALMDNLPEAIDGLHKPHRDKPFSDVVERLKKSVGKELREAVDTERHNK